MRFVTAVGRVIHMIFRPPAARTAVIHILGVGILVQIGGQLCLAQTPAGPPRTTHQFGAVTQGSESWLSIFPTRQQIFGLYGDVKSPDTLYASTHRGLFKSSNGGLTWALVYGVAATSLTFAQSNASPNVM